jgi:hypothetical protein
VRALLAIAAAAAVLLLAPGAGAGPLPPSCRTAQMTMRFVFDDAGAGHRDWDMSLTNDGAAGCRMFGYPGVSILGKNHKPLRVRVVRDTAFAAKPVIVAPGKKAYFTFGYVDSGPCLPHFYSGYGIRVFPPNTKSALTYTTPRFDICAVSIGGSPNVFPVRATLNP